MVLFDYLKGADQIRQQRHPQADDADQSLGDGPSPEGLGDAEAQAFLDHPEPAVVEMR